MISAYPQKESGALPSDRAGGATPPSRDASRPEALIPSADNVGWRPFSDTAWLDGRDVVLLAYDMEVHARYCPGEWSDDTPVNPREYSGAVWSCFDDEFQIEIEETSHDPSEWHHGRATHWRNLTPRPEAPLVPDEAINALVDDGWDWWPAYRYLQSKARDAQAIETRRAETQSGSVHESAVGGNADAPGT